MNDAKGSGRRDFFCRTELRTRIPRERKMSRSAGRNSVQGGVNGACVRIEGNASFDVVAHDQVRNGHHGQRRTAEKESEDTKCTAVGHGSAPARRLFLSLDAAEAAVLVAMQWRVAGSHGTVHHRVSLLTSKRASQPTTSSAAYGMREAAANGSGPA